MENFWELNRAKNYWYANYLSKRLIKLRKSTASHLSTSLHLQHDRAVVERSDRRNKELQKDDKGNFNSPSSSILLCLSGGAISCKSNRRCNQTPDRIRLEGILELKSQTHTYTFAFPRQLTNLYCCMNESCIADCNCVLIIKLKKAGPGISKRQTRISPEIKEN